jgi:hypothetical protein
MATGDTYRIKAAELSARARGEKHPAIRGEYENLCLAYLRLADQADRNSETDVVYETPPSSRKNGSGTQ